MNRRYRKTIIAGNWKMNKTASETKKFAEELKALLPKAKWCDIVVCVPSVRYRRRHQGLQGCPRVRGRTECVL